MSWLSTLIAGILIGYYLRPLLAWRRERRDRKNFKPVALRVYRPAARNKGDAP